MGPMISICFDGVRDDCVCHEVVVSFRYANKGNFENGPDGTILPFPTIDRNVSGNSVIRQIRNIAL